MKTKAFIFDLDGVIVDTAKYHYLAWKKLANNLNIDFTHEHNELLKGVSRVRSLEIILGLGNVEASDEQKNEWLVQKNKEYLELSPLIRISYGRVIFLVKYSKYSKRI